MSVLLAYIIRDGNQGREEEEEEEEGKTCKLNGKQ